MEKEKNTYFCFESEDKKTKLEIDLVTSRQRGQETRFLTFKTTLQDEVEGKVETADCNVYINSEQEFNKVKNFFAGLTWND